MRYRNHYYGCGPWQARAARFYSSAPVNITESNEQYTISLFAPALSKEKFSITTHKDVLTIRYNGADENTSDNFTRREYRVKELERSFDLNGKVIIEQITAEYKDGVLMVNLPKTDAAKAPAKNVNIH